MSAWTQGAVGVSPIGVQPLLKDGATGQTAASVQVKPQQAQGRLIFVGYRLE